MASHLGLFCLPMTHKKDARLIWVDLFVLCDLANKRNLSKVKIYCDSSLFSRGHNENFVSAFFKISSADLWDLTNRSISAYILMYRLSLFLSYSLSKILTFVSRLVKEYCYFPNCLDR